MSRLLVPALALCLVWSSATHARSPLNATGRRQFVPVAVSRPDADRVANLELNQDVSLVSDGVPRYVSHSGTDFSQSSLFQSDYQMLITESDPSDETQDNASTKMEPPKEAPAKCLPPESWTDDGDGPENDQSDLSEVVDKILEHVVPGEDSDPESIRARAVAAQTGLGKEHPILVAIRGEMSGDMAEDLDPPETDQTLNLQDASAAEPFLTPEMDGEPENRTQVTVEEGARIRLVCNVTGVQHYWVEWRRAANLTFPGGAVVVGGRSVLLDYVGREDAGLYSCTAKTTLGHTHSNNVTIHVHYAPVVGLWARDTGVGEVELGCLAEGRPRPAISWYINNTRIHSNGCNRNVTITTTILSPGFLLSVALIHNASSSDYGYYHCRAINMQGSTRGFIMLHDGQLDAEQLRKIHKEEYVTPVENPRLASFMLGMVPPLYIALYIIAYLGCYKTSVSGVPGAHGRFGASYDVE
ncbi:neuronal cell adhesion molecule-like isoform X2 [Penaeus chinensis]|uniref:neuronal cell adhesion molecule-like isoform X2 n=1 Tax=Penaeus chinensis TaxID=139456 RepID=UPI001FB5C26B|nr:neuronal cell adhesion molecule-like isoform X2 [Penaeus chinensis]